MAAIDLQLRVAVEATAATLMTSGEIYLANAAAAPPRVTHVIASATWPTRFSLDPGHYEYRFHVERAGGVFTLLLARGDGRETLASREFDTAFGMEHRVFHFEVK